MMDNVEPLISVLIPYYNDELFLKESIESVLNQTYKNFELILINHASTDSSRKIAHSFLDERIIHVDLPKNAGAGGGIIIDSFLKVARGNFYKFFCADDLLHDDYLEKCLVYIETNPNIDFCFTNEEYIDEEGRLLSVDFYTDRTKHIVESDDWNFMALKDYFHAVSNLPFSSCFIKKDCFENIKIDFTFVMIFDMSVFLQMLLNNRKIGFIKENLVSYRIHKGQISSSVNLKKCMSASFFEHIPFLNIFFETDNTKLLQKLLNRNDLSSIEALRLEMAKYFLSIPDITYQIVGYQYLHEFFQNDHNRNSGEYSIAEFRDTYKKSFLATKCLQNPVSIDEIGIKKLIKLLIEKFIKKIIPQKKEILSHV